MVARADMKLVHGTRIELPTRSHAGRNERRDVHRKHDGAGIVWTRVDENIRNIDAGPAHRQW